MALRLEAAWLPRWPQVPPRLWLTVAAVGLVGLSLIFEREIWPSHPSAGRWGAFLLAVLLQVSSVQVISLLRQWPAAYVGPGWLWLIIRSAALGIIVLAILLLILSVLGGLWLLAMLL